MIIYVTAIVPAAYRNAVEQAIAPLLLGPPGNEFSVELCGLTDTTLSHYATCAALDDESSRLLGALPNLLAQIPGGSYQVVPLSQWYLPRDWTGWLANKGLRVKPQVTP